ncbi:MAG: hypothetical protein J6N72_10600, partial [Psychrobacter sp.]|nr:hypothetical protein [Psychrobacter sp.]
MENSDFTVSMISGLGLIPIGYYFIKLLIYKKQGDQVEAYICLKNLVFLTIALSVILAVLQYII